MVGSRSKVKKAVIVAAGFGTRFLPASKAIPKVMFPVIDKPIIQYVVEDLVESGISDITFVVSPYFPETKKYFEPSVVLNELLMKAGKEEQIEKLKKIENLADFHFVEQKPGGIVGTGAALLPAKEAVADEPFFLSWADEFYLGNPPRAKQSIDVYERFGGMVIGCLRTTDPRDGDRWGFVVGDKVDKNVVRVTQLVEKPGEGKAPSELATMSGQVLLPEVFDYLEEARRGLLPGKELYVNVHGMGKMLADGYPIYGVEFQGCRYFDTGDKLGYLKTLVELGLESEEFGEEFREYLKGLV
ncbi:MAG TPA: UTP--glucose-1-phosphate uridylyltransferase [Patescibacteria group bacterium]|nr:UTP--glucose-1-phosphate uridylyltransferase [Patescibacteria group bacterium]